VCVCERERVCVKERERVHIHIHTSTHMHTHIHTQPSRSTPPELDHWRVSLHGLHSGLWVVCVMTWSCDTMSLQPVDAKLDTHACVSQVGSEANTRERYKDS